MKVFKKLMLTGDSGMLDKIYAYLSSLSNIHWKYDKKKSNDYALGIGEKLQNTITLCTSSKMGKKAFVWLVRSGNRIELTNITPMESGRLTIDEYNEIVDSLVKELRNKSEAVFSIETTNDNLSFEDIAGKKIADAFYKWSESCNPSTGNLHPFDAERWREFVILSHKNKRNLDATYLERFLKEQPKFYDEEVISSLVHDYEYGMELLSQNDEF